MATTRGGTRNSHRASNARIPASWDRLADFVEGPFAQIARLADLDEETVLEQ